MMTVLVNWAFILSMCGVLGSVHLYKRYNPTRDNVLRTYGHMKDLRTAATFFSWTGRFFAGLTIMCSIYYIGLGIN